MKKDNKTEKAFVPKKMVAKKIEEQDFELTDILERILSNLEKIEDTIKDTEV